MLLLLALDIAQGSLILLSLQLQLPPPLPMLLMLFMFIDQKLGEIMTSKQSLHILVSSYRPLFLAYSKQVYIQKR